MSNAAERELLGQIFSGVLALFGILIAVVGILLGLYTSQKGYSTVASLLWWLIVGTTVAVAWSGVTAALALSRLRGRLVPLGLIAGSVYVLLALATACTVVVAVVGLSYL